MIIGIFPEVPMAGVTGILNVVVAAGTKPVVFGVVHETTCPSVEQVQPPLVNVAGEVKPTGNVVVNVNGPVPGAVPWFVTVTGIFDVTPSVSAGDGCPIVVTKSGRGIGKIFAEGIIVAVLLGTTFSVGTGATVPETGKALHAVPIAGVIGILNVVLVVGAKPAVFGFVHVTVCAEVKHVQPFWLNNAGAV